MGGSAFKEHGLSTPRMPPAIYHFVLRQVEDKLSTTFCQVAHCIEAPGKKDYGDLDVLVLSDPAKPAPSLDHISKLLEAKRFYHGPSNGVSAFAIPWRSPPLTSPTVIKDNSVTHSYSSSTTNDTRDSDLYIQLDLKICTSHQDLTWSLFVHAHADLISIISATIRRKGLTITDKALYLRIQDIETHNKKLARVELSRDPNQVLQYLGLPLTRFWQPFGTLDEIMTYIATCRFHNPARINGADSSELGHDENIQQTLNSHDNHRLTCRPMFQYWFQTYLPSHTTDQPGTSAHLSRTEILSDAFTFFGPEIQQQYEKQSRESTATIQRGQLWSNIRKQILASHPDISDHDMHDTLKALKREILPSTSSTTQAPNSHPASLQSAYLANDFPTLISYALANHVAALTRYRTFLSDSAHKAIPLDLRKSNPHSTSALETYSPDDDDVIVRMKREGATWGDMLAVLGKTSRSQLVGRWKELQGKEQDGGEKEGRTGDGAEEKEDMM